MTMKTRNLLFALLAAFIIPTGILAQEYCIPPGFKDMGGVGEPFTFISNVTLENLNHSSGMPTGQGLDKGYMYYSNEATPVLQPGQTYSLKVSSGDNLGQGMEVYVWIDWDGNKEFSSNGLEKVAVWGGAGNHGIDITVPLDATLGLTRMRVYCDMPPGMGHIPAEPCGYLNHPSHAIGQHGEVEDYDVQIGNTTGIGDVDAQNDVILYPNPANNELTIENNIVTQKNFFIVDVFGRQLMQGQLNNGMHTIDVSALDAGQYIIFIEGAEIQRQTFQIYR